MQSGDPFSQPHCWHLSRVGKALPASWNKELIFESMSFPSLDWTAFVFTMSSDQTSSRLPCCSESIIACHLWRPIMSGSPRRFEHTHWKGLESELIELWVDRVGGPPEVLVLDADATNLELHGDQEDKFFDGYYGHYCYLPLYIFCGGGQSR